MVDLLQLWKEHVFLNDPRVRRVSIKFASAVAVVVLVTGLVTGLLQEGPGVPSDVAPASAEAPVSCPPAGNASADETYNTSVAPCPGDDAEP